jgi:hypothetical protein
VRSSNGSRLPGGVDGRSAVAPYCPPYGSHVSGCPRSPSRRARPWLGHSAQSWQLVAFRVSVGLDPQLARFAFDVGNLAFANAWVAMSSFPIAASWACEVPELVQTI